MEIVNGHAGVGNKNRQAVELAGMQRGGAGNNERQAGRQAMIIKIISCMQAGISTIGAFTDTCAIGMKANS